MQLCKDEENNVRPCGEKNKNILSFYIFFSMKQNKKSYFRVQEMFLIVSKPPAADPSVCSLYFSRPHSQLFYFVILQNQNQDLPGPEGWNQNRTNNQIEGT